jgi:predicted aconitase
MKKQTIWAKIGAFIAKEEVCIEKDFKTLGTAIGKFFTNEVPKIEALIAAAAADYKILLAAAESPAVQAAIAAIEKFIAQLALELA